MRYRIKIITYKSGRKEYYSYVRGFLGWVGLDWKGCANIHYTATCPSREEALECIDKHFSVNAKTQRIDFEYIDK